MNNQIIKEVKIQSVVNFTEGAYDIVKYYAPDGNLILKLKFFGFRGRGGVSINLKIPMSTEQLKKIIVEKALELRRDFVEHNKYPQQEVIFPGKYETGKEATEMYYGDVISSDYYFN